MLNHSSVMMPMSRANSSRPVRIKSGAVSTLPKPACDGSFCFSSIISDFMIDGSKIRLTCMQANTSRAVAIGKPMNAGWESVNPGLSVPPPVPDKA